jgi:hypothetical protein
MFVWSVAKREIEQRKLPFLVRRQLPNGSRSIGLHRSWRSCGKMSLYLWIRDPNLRQAMRDHTGQSSSHR